MSWFSGFYTTALAVPHQLAKDIDFVGVTVKRKHEYEFIIFISENIIMLQCTKVIGSVNGLVSLGNKLSTERKDC